MPPVSESMCQARTKEIMDSQRDLMKKVTEIYVIVTAHDAWHKGQANAKKLTASRVGLAIKVIALSITAIGSLGGVIWYLARSIG